MMNIATSTMDTYTPTFDFAGRKKYYTKEQAENVCGKIDRASGLVKLAMGLSINASRYMMLNALDSVKKHPKYKHEIKRAFALADKAYKDFERVLRHGNLQTPVFFSTKFYKPQYFKDGMTSDEYFEIWQALGGAAYDDSKNEFGVLKHKYELALEHNGSACPGIGGEILLVSCLLRITQNIFDVMMKEICKGIPELGKDVIEGYVFRPFNIKQVAEAWHKAVIMLYGDFFKCSDFDERNIKMGIQQIEEKWCSEKWIEKMQEKTLRDYEDYIGGKKKTAKLIKDIRTAWNEGGIKVV